jgi:nucleotide-binding universal stress UspA family protein
MYSKLHIALDGSEHSKQTAKLGLELAKGLGAKLTAVHVRSPSRIERRLARLQQTLSAADAAETAADQEVPRVRTGWLADEADDAGVSFGSERLEGTVHQALLGYMEPAEEDLLIVGAWGQSKRAGASLGSVTERYLRKCQSDTLVIKNPDSFTVGDGAYLGEEGAILVCIDGSPRSYAGLNAAIDLATRFNRRVEAVGVYDPYLHYTLFNGIVGVLSEKAAKVFKFADQEKLHEEIIDTGLAKIYQAHLDVARKVAENRGVQVRTVLLDGKAYEKILQYIRKTEPALLVLGRIGVHSEEEMDIGATAENLLRAAPCNVLITSQKFTPPLDVQAAESVEWTPAALSKMARVPGFVKGVATTAVIRWAIERGHSVITASVINDAMGSLLPVGAAQAMGYVAEEMAKNVDDYTFGKTFLCPECGYAAKDFEPKKCPVCKTDGAEFQMIDRATIEEAGELEKGDLIAEETFDGKTLTWTIEAQETLARVPKGYDRRRSKARIEKTARVRGIEVITKVFAIDMIEQDIAENSYLSDAGEVLKVDIKRDETLDDAAPRDREGSTWQWTDAAWTRISRVPAGFMRDMTRERVEQFVAGLKASSIDLDLCEKGIAEGRKMMAEMLGSYSSGDANEEVIKDAIGTLPGYKEAEESADALRAASADETAPEPVQAAPEDEAKCPVPHGAMEAMKNTPAEDSACPAAGMVDADGKIAWTEGAEQKVEETKARVVDAGKFDAERAEQLTRGVAEERGKEKRMLAINETFMAKLGKQLGYGHPLAQVTAEYEFEWTPEAEARLQDIPEFCREMSKWRVEWTAVKLDLGRVITPEIMDKKFEMWGEVSESYMEREGKRMEWSPEAWARVEKIPDFVQGQVLDSVEGNARRWGHEMVTSEVLDKVIERWIDTGDFHEAQFGYK